MDCAGAKYRIRPGYSLDEVNAYLREISFEELVQSMGMI